MEFGQHGGQGLNASSYGQAVSGCHERFVQPMYAAASVQTPSIPPCRRDRVFSSDSGIERRGMCSGFEDGVQGAALEPRLATPSALPASLSGLPAFPAGRWS